MFADDTTLTVPGESVLDAEVAINHDLANIKQWLSANKLPLNLVKTEYLLIGSRHNINNLSHAPKVHVGDIPIKRVKETKALGVYIDKFLSCFFRWFLRNNKLITYTFIFTIKSYKIRITRYYKV